MSESPIPPATPASTPSSNGSGVPIQTIVIQQPVPVGHTRRWLFRLVIVGLIASLLVNVSMYTSYRDYFASSSPPAEQFHSGDAAASDKIALLRMSTTIMPPFTERLLKSIRRAANDDSVKGVVLVIDSPGGLVADSHQIYHRLKELSAKKPMMVAMKRMAASGGYYIAMGAGPDATIYVEPTTWTGSIGVIIPRYNAAKLADKIGISSEPLKTGRFKDSLSPFRELPPDERALWETILNDSFEKFLNVIAENRKTIYRRDRRLFGLNAAAIAAFRAQLGEPPGTAVEDIATGQIFTANQALKAGLVDKIGYVDDAVNGLKSRLKLDSVRVVTYKHPQSLLGLLTGFMKANQPHQRWQSLTDATIPRAMYYCAGLPLISVPYTTAQ